MGKRKSPVPGTAPGDRGDSVRAKGFAGLKAHKSPAMPSKFRSECSRGYEDAPSGWAGNVKR